MSRYHSAQWSFRSWTFRPWTLGGGSGAVAVTVYVSLPGLSSVSGMKLWLYTPPGVELNPGGSPLSLVSGSGGTFTATIPAAILALPYTVARIMEGSTFRAEGCFANAHPVMRKGISPRVMPLELRARVAHPMRLQVAS